MLPAVGVPAQVYAHPCGQAVDWIFYCYRLPMRTGSGVEPVQVQWFPAPQGAKLIDVPTPFHSRWNDGTQDNDGLGEQWPDGFTAARRKYRFGLCHPETVPCYRLPACYLGVSRCGSDRVWSDGGELGRDPLFEVNEVGRPECCPAPDPDPCLYLRGGESEGGFMSAATCEIPYGFCRQADGGEYEGGEMLVPPPYVGDSLAGESVFPVCANTKPAGVLEGDLLVICNGVSAAGGIPPLPTGFTSLASGDTTPNGFSRYRLSYKVAGSSEPANYAVVPGGMQGAVWFVIAIRNWQGVPTVAEQDGNSTTPTAPSVVAPAGKALLLSFWNRNIDLANTWVAPSSMTLVVNTAASPAGRCYQEDIPSAGPVGSRIASYGPNAGQWAAYSLVVR